jgi:hypothetical protein
VFYGGGVVSLTSSFCYNGISFSFNKILDNWYSKVDIMNSLLQIFALINTLMSFTTQLITIDPTGTYQLDNKTKRKNGEIYGYFGKIQVKKITVNKIVMTFEVNKGAPSYNSGSFVDTLSYYNNMATYKTPEVDSTCKVTFVFSKNGVTVTEETANYNFGCGFGHAVIADGFYKKVSSKVPILVEPLTGEKL